eukprot:2667055-Heterocapsa_arctica.AAC.1
MEADDGSDLIGPYEGAFSQCHAPQHAQQQQSGIEAQQLADVFGQTEAAAAPPTMEARFSRIPFMLAKGEYDRWDG